MVLLKNFHQGLCSARWGGFYLVCVVASWPSNPDQVLDDQDLDATYMELNFGVILRLLLPLRVNFAGTSSGAKGMSIKQPPR